MKPELHEKIQKLQGIEENLHNYLGQKQQVQAQLMEMESATDALDSAKQSYRIIGNIMVEEAPAQVKKSVAERMEIAKVRFQSLEKQEAKLKDEAERLQKEIMAGMKEKGE